MRSLLGGRFWRLTEVTATKEGGIRREGVPFRSDGTGGLTDCRRGLFMGSLTRRRPLLRVGHRPTPMTSFYLRKFFRKPPLSLPLKTSSRHLPPFYSVFLVSSLCSSCYGLLMSH